MTIFIQEHTEYIDVSLRHTFLIHVSILQWLHILQAMKTTLSAVL